MTTHTAINLDSLFLSDIHRNINGVIKVGQKQEENIFEELSEYVVTRELDKHFHTFFNFYAATLNQPTDKIGIWISGFFGSGKSHFLKILSYLLENREVKGQKALSFFDGKISDEMLEADMQKVGRYAPHTDVILFNIDSEADADSKRQKDAVVKVLWKVFYKNQGFFGEAPHIAEMEAFLERKNQYSPFKQAFLQASGESWESARDGWAFLQDEITQALIQACGMSEESARKLLDYQEATQDFSVQSFAKKVKAYLDQKGPQHRVLFLIDEVGQYIGEDSHLMLNLQTVAEDLGTYCEGRAWIMVTSQEAIDSLTKNKIKGDDFSKIQGRFNPRNRINLSSANTDEVIKLRLLKKKEASSETLCMFYQQWAATLKNLISFSENTAELLGYRSEGEFVEAYPFVPYQFKLLQAVFTAIRKTGASGKHLAAGERSMLDSFQLALQQMSKQSLGVLVPFHAFYASIEGFLDAAVKRVISQAADNTRLNAFDVDLLKILFMVKHVKEVRPNLENLCTLSLDSVNVDKINLRETIQVSLQKLERETLIQRNGDEYYFLTNEEQEIGREIKEEPIDDRMITQALHEAVWDHLFTDKKFKFNKLVHYDYNRQIDSQFFGGQSSELTLHILTPCGEEYAEYTDQTCMGRTMGADTALVRLPDQKALYDEIEEFVKTDKFIRRKNSGSLPESLRLILQQRATENQKRKERIRLLLADLIARADVYAWGAKLEISKRETVEVLSEALRSLIEHVYSKQSYITSPYPSEKEIEVALVQPPFAGEQHPNRLAIADMKNWFQDQAVRHRKVTLRNVLDQFSGKPYGWAELDILGILAELLREGELELRHKQSRVNLKESDVVKQLRSKRTQEEYLLQPQQKVLPEHLKIGRELAKACFEKNHFPTDEEAFFQDFRRLLELRLSKLKEYRPLAEKQAYPCHQAIEESMRLLVNLISHDHAAAFFKALSDHQDDFDEQIEDYEIIHSFFESQVKAYDQARSDLQALKADVRHLQDESLKGNLNRIQEILKMSAPYKFIHELPALMGPVKEKVRELLQQQRLGLEEKTALTLKELEHTALEQKLGTQDIAKILQATQSFLKELPQVHSIDGLIARELELPALEAQAHEKLIELLKAQIPPEVTHPTPQLKKQVTISPASLAKHRVIKTQAELEEFIETLRHKLQRELDQDHQIKLQ